MVFDLEHYPTNNIVDDLFEVHAGRRLLLLTLVSNLEHFTNTGTVELSEVSVILAGHGLLNIFIFIRLFTFLHVSFCFCFSHSAEFYP